MTGARSLSGGDPGKRADISMLRTANKLQLVVEASGMGIWEFDPQTEQVHWDDRVLEMFGLTDGQNYRPKDVWESFIHPDDLEATLAYSDQCRRDNCDFRRDYRILRRDGEVRHIRSLARDIPATDAEGKLIGVNIDITDDVERREELERARRQLEFDSRHDALTGLANRRKLDEDTADLFAGMAPDDRCAVMQLDLDLFKQINDSLGHAFGDAVLVSTARRLSEIIADQGLVSRTGGDEFVIVLPNAPRRAGIEALCETLISRCQAPIRHLGHSSSVGISIGVAVTVGPPQSPTKLFANADAALYAAKGQGRSCFRLFDADIRSRSERDSTIRQDLIDALASDQITCHFQPQFHAETHQIIGAEALVRWISPKRGLMIPEDFMPMAQKAGLTAQIDARVFRKVIDCQSRWAAAGLDFPPVALNISTERLMGDGLVEEVRWRLHDHHRVSFELLETAFLDDAEPRLLTRIERLRALGIGVELDDFGSGRSSVVALQAIRPDRVKIDQRLVDPICHDPNQLLLLQSLSKIARLSGAQVVVEGLETSIHMAAIRNVDCDGLQGFALSHPMSEADFATLLGTPGRKRAR